MPEEADDKAAKEAIKVLDSVEIVDGEVVGRKVAV